MQGNNPFLELVLGSVPNSTTCSTNSTVELLHGGVGGAELQKLERSSPKLSLVKRSNMMIKRALREYFQEISYKEPTLFFINKVDKSLFLISIEIGEKF